LQAVSTSLHIIIGAGRQDTGLDAKRPVTWHGPVKPGHYSWLTKCILKEREKRKRERKKVTKKEREKEIKREK